MPTYCAFLGHQPNISLAELTAAIPDFTFERVIGRHAALFRTKESLEQADLARLGGTVLLARAVSTGADIGFDDIPGILVAELQSRKGKVTFGLRGEGVPPRILHKLYRDCKDALKRAGKSSRYVGNERHPAATVLLRDAGLLDGSHGCELVLVADGDFLWIGRTCAAQDPDNYTKRDMGKPARDTRVGLLPPKLAQVMLNLGTWMLGETKKKAPAAPAVYDPFCGSGVVLLEAMLLGWPALGSDASQKSVNATLKNIEWLRKEWKIAKKDVPADAWKHDATKPFAPPFAVDLVVTETALGPALTERPNAKDAAKIKTECERLEIAFLKNAATTLPGVPLVMTWPVWYLKTGQLFLEKVWETAADLKYRPCLPPGIAFDVPGRVSLLYRRPDQLVGREIVLLKPMGAKT